MFNLIKNRKHPNVGRIFYSPYFKRRIEIVAFNGTDRWWFCFHGTAGTTKYREFKANTDLRYFEENGLEVT